MNGATDSATVELDALERARAFVEPSVRIVQVRGPDARRWLHDLVTTDVRSLVEGQSRRSLLLTPTGRIRADFHVASAGDRLLLLQATDQPEAIDTILRPYVLSSDVELESRDDLAVVAVFRDADEDEVDADGVDAILRPSMVAGNGIDLVVRDGAPRRRVGDRLAAGGLVDVGPVALEAWRIRRGVPRMQIDFGQDALPAEAGLEETIDFGKGCFLGQESVAKVRNLGHPPRELVPVRAPARTVAGAAVLGPRGVVGEITSATSSGDGVDAIARVRWGAASEPLSTKAGPLSLRHRE